MKSGTIVADFSIEEQFPGHQIFDRICAAFPLIEENVIDSDNSIPRLKLNKASNKSYISPEPCSDIFIAIQGKLDVIPQKNEIMSIENLLPEIICTFCGTAKHLRNSCPFTDEWYSNHVFRQRIDSHLRPVLLNFESFEFKPNVCFAQTFNDKLNQDHFQSIFPEFGGKINFNIDLESEQIENLGNLLLKFRDCFAFDPLYVGKCNILEFTVDTGDAKPIQRSPYKYADFQRDLIEDHIHKWIIAGISKPCQSPWGQPVVLVDKKSVDEMGKPQTRLCADMRFLNNVTKSDIYPLPAVKDLLNALNGSKYFSILDALWFSSG